MKFFDYEGLSGKEDLYRYLSFEKFLSLCETSSHVFIQPSAWDDPWENVISDLLNPCAQLNLSLTPKAFYDNVFMSCWSLLDESDAMWRIYSPNKNGVKIKINLSSFEFLQGTTEVFARKVQYYKNLDELCNIHNNLKDCNMSLYQMTLKRKLFEHEHEVRLMSSYAAVDKACIKGNSSKSRTPKDIALLGFDISKHIKEVVVDPRISTWELDTLHSYCQRMLPNTVFRKSDIYDPVISYL
ncbi:DUF2971 domain-containing protein [Aliivibrio fischeri]|uniref:DUF2971 domain-containing protein n=1 Tax=Aliivibrio fischeri SR5 TaxID=1088719 RepID=A0AAV3ENJ1_ALIFS|nr:DUF2971 domain-containing protein [Aliivibrio fischeri]EHN68520.1 hypothetical protein VFSR5_A0602 [Aliivibrio fischeri SR5]